MGLSPMAMVMAIKNICMGLREMFVKKCSVEQSGLLEMKTDRHSHVLPGVDDGIQRIEDSLSAISYLENLGISDLWCTPHIMEEMPNKTEDLRLRFNELCQAYKGKVKLHLSPEYMMDLLFEKRLKERDLIVGDDGFLLMETYGGNSERPVLEMLEMALSAGYKPLLAHPERYHSFSEKVYSTIRSMGVSFQLNLPSVLGAYGDTVRRKSLMLLQKGWYECMGSDCHRCARLVEQYRSKVLPPRVLELLGTL